MTWRNADGLPDWLFMGDELADRRAVVVEDDADIRMLLARTLQRHGFDVAEAITGAEGLRLAREHVPDLVTLDLNLPDLDGTEVCRRLREFSDAYIVMITGRAEEIDELIGLQIGADDYISKPFSPRTVQARIEAMFRRPRTFGGPGPGGPGLGHPGLGHPGLGHPADPSGLAAGRLADTGAAIAQDSAAPAVPGVPVVPAVDGRRISPSSSAPRAGSGRGRCSFARSGATNGPRTSTSSRSTWATSAASSATAAGAPATSAPCAASATE